jgi:hypothetical protein
MTIESEMGENFDVFHMGTGAVLMAVAVHARSYTISTAPHIREHI